MTAAPIDFLRLRITSQVFDRVKEAEEMNASMERFGVGLKEQLVCRGEKIDAQKKERRNPELIIPLQVCRKAAGEPVERERRLFGARFAQQCRD